MPTPIMMLELKGFAAMATQLARDMDPVVASPERIRASQVSVVTGALDAARSAVRETQRIHIGGDTWFLTFDELDQAIAFGALLLRHFRDLVSSKGLFYLKPSLALTLGEPKLLNDRFLDDASISAYRAADGGKPFHFYLLGDAYQVAKRFQWLALSDVSAPEGSPPHGIVDWLTAKFPDLHDPVVPDVSLPTLLLDSEVLYAQSPSEATANLLRQQARARKVYAFGGPVPLQPPYYRDYVRTTLASLRLQQGPAFTVLSYIPANEAIDSYAWLELCRLLTIEHPTRFAFAAFLIPAGQLRPFSYQVFDDSAVHVGLRSYSPQKGTPTMSAAIMVRNRDIALRFKEEFVENWRQLGPMNDLHFARLVDQLSGLNVAGKQAALREIDLLLHDQ